MTIGIDIDGVLTNLSDFQLTRGKEYFGEIVNEKAFEIRNIFNCNRIKELEFWSKNLDYYYLGAKKGSSDYINLLHLKGHKIVIITARNIILKKITLDWLEKNNIYYDKIIFTCNKLQAMKDNNVDLIVEDSPKYIKELSKYYPVVSIKCPYNEDITNDNIYQVIGIDEMIILPIVSNNKKLSKKLY